MSIDRATRRARFRALHQSGCFLLPNPWDVGSAKRLAAMGFEALASTSSGAAWTQGKQDGELTLEEVRAHLEILCEATDLPVNADFEAGFADGPDGVAENVRRAVQTGVAGLSIEDNAKGRLYDVSVAVERIAAARGAIDRSGEDVILVGRSEGFLLEAPSLEDTIKRLVAYADAGADCLYAPGVQDLSAIREIVAAVAPKPVNVLLNKPGLRVDELAAAGVRRISTGGALAAAAWSGFERAARMLRDEGTMPPRG